MNDILKIYVFNKKQNSCLFIISTLSIALMLLRVKATHNIYLMFLLWNLFLAYIPYLISSNIKNDIAKRKLNPFFYIKLGIWLLFLPNSFYLITDFVHLHHINTIQYLYDAMLFSCFTMAGFYAGILSVYEIQKAIKSVFYSKKAESFIIVTCFLSAFGIYLGRVLRFNSWDVISNPMLLFDSMINSLFQIEAIVFTLLLGAFILATYKVTYNLILKK